MFSNKFTLVVLLLKQHFNRGHDRSHFTEKICSWTTPSLSASWKLSHHCCFSDTVYCVFSSPLCTKPSRHLLLGVATAQCSTQQAWNNGLYYYLCYGTVFMPGLISQIQLSCKWMWKKQSTTTLWETFLNIFRKMTNKACSAALLLALSNYHSKIGTMIWNRCFSFFFSFSFFLLFLQKHWSFKLRKHTLECVPGLKWPATCLFYVPVTLLMKRRSATSVNGSASFREGRSHFIYQRPVI